MQENEIPRTPSKRSFARTWSSPRGESPSDPWSPSKRRSMGGLSPSRQIMALPSPSRRSVVSSSSPSGHSVFKHGECSRTSNPISPGRTTLEAPGAPICIDINGIPTAIGRVDYRTHLLLAATWSEGRHALDPTGWWISEKVCSVYFGLPSWTVFERFGMDPTFGRDAASAGMRPIGLLKVRVLERLTQRFRRFR